MAYKLILEIEKRPPIYTGNKDLRCLDNFFPNLRKIVNLANGLGIFRVYLAEKYDDNRTLNVAGLIIENEEDGNSTDTFLDCSMSFLRDILYKFVLALILPKYHRKNSRMSDANISYLGISSIFQLYIYHYAKL